MSNFTYSTPTSPDTKQLNREAIARQLLPLLQQFEATFDHAALIDDDHNLYLALKRLIFVAQYHASKGGEA